MTETRPRVLVIFIAALGLGACHEPSDTGAHAQVQATSKSPKRLPPAGPVLLSVGPRLLSNQTSQPVSVLGERLEPGLSLRLGAPVNQLVPLTVLDDKHGYARLPAGLAAGSASETLIKVSLEKGEGTGELRLIADTTFPDLTAAALSGDGRHWYVVSGTEDRVYDVDLVTNAVTPIAVGDGPAAVAVWQGSIAVAHRFSPQLWLIKTSNPSEVRTLSAPASASGLVIDAKKSVAFVAEQARDTVTAISLIDGKRLWVASVGANPREMMLTPKGLVVGSLQTGELQLLDAATGTVLRGIEPVPGTSIVGGHTAKYSKYVMNGTAPRGFAWSARSRRLFVTSIGPNIGPNPDKMEVSMNGGVGVVDLDAAKGFVRHLGFNAGVTEALALDDAHGLLYASDVSLGVVRVIDVKKLISSDAAAETAVIQELSMPPPEGFPHVRPDGDFGVKGRAGLSLHSGPKALALSPDSKTLFVLNRYTGTVAHVDVTTAAAGKAVFVSQARIVDTLAQKTRRLGQVLYFADLGRTAMSCDACHVEGHTQGVLFEKTMPLRIYRSPTVRGSRETPPFFTPASTRSMGETMKVVGSRNRFHNPDPVPEEIEALTLFGSTLPTLPNPFAGDDGAPVETLTLPDGAKGHPRAGLVLFEGKANCSGCHPGPHFTLDQSPETRNRFIDVGTPHLMPLREGYQNPIFEGFGTPALAGAWDVFPMLTTGLAGLTVTPDERVVVDSRFPMRVAIEKWAPKHGRADLLTEQERNDLLAYVMSL